eukprot:gene7899-690_t
MAQQSDNSEQSTQAAPQLPAAATAGLRQDEQEPFLSFTSHYPTRDYLDETVVPVLLEGLAALAQERPPKPIEWLGTFLLKCSKEEGEGSEGTQSKTEQQQTQES